MIKKIQKINRYLPYSRQKLDRLDIGKVVKVLKSSFITQGPEILNFEKKFLNWKTFNSFKKNIVDSKLKLYEILKKITKAT